MTNRVLYLRRAASAALAGTASFVLVALPAEAQEGPLQSPPNCSVVCYRPLAREVLRTTPDHYGAAQQDVARVVSDPQIENTMRSALQRFESEEQRVSSDLEFTRQVQRTWEMGWALKDDMPLSDTIPTSVFSTGQQQAIDQDIERLERRSAQLAPEILGAAFDNIRASHAQLLEQLRNEQDWNVVHDSLFGPDNLGGVFANTEVFRRLPTEAKTELALLRVDLVRGQLQALSSRQAYTEDQISALVTDYTQFRSKVAEFAAETRQHIGALVQGQRSLTRAYQTLSGWVQNNTYRIDALEGVMFGTLTSRQQVEALNSGAFSSVLAGRSAAEVRQFREDLQRAAVLEDISNTAGVVRDVANNFAAIGNVLGIDLSEPVQKINKAATIAQSLIGIASGNPLAVINGLGGLAGVLGPGGGDGTSSALKALRQEIQQMRREMYEYHVQEMQAIEGLSRQLDQRFSELASLQGSTLDQIGFNTRQLDELLKQQLNTCVQLADQWRLRDGETHDIRAERINQNYTNLFISCRDGVRNRFYQLNPEGTTAISTIFSHQSLSDVQTGDDGNQILAIQRYRNETLQPTVGYTLRNQPYGADLANCPSNQLAFAALLRGPRRHGDIRNTASQLRERCLAGPTRLYVTADNRPYNLEAVLSNPISVTNVLFYGRAVYDAMAIYEFMNQPGSANPRVLRVSQLFGPRTTAAATRAQAAAGELQRVLDVVNLGIAQLNILGGDLVLDVLMRDIEAGLDDASKRDISRIPPTAWAQCSASESTAAAYFNALCLLQRNQVLRYNFVRYWVRSRFNRPGLDALASYPIGMTISTDAQVLSGAFSRRMPIARCGDAWCMRLPGAPVRDPDPSPINTTATRDSRFDLTGDMDLRLPEWGEVATDRQAVASPQLDQLLVLRRDLLNRIAEFRGTFQLAPEEAQLVFSSLIVDHVERPVAQ